MNQLSMNLYQPPATHRNDPYTSSAAEKSAPIKGQALEVYEALKRYSPCTMYELAEKSGIDYYICQRRAKILEINHLAKRAGTKPNPVTGKENQIWHIRT